MFLGLHVSKSFIKETFFERKICTLTCHLGKKIIARGGKKKIFKLLLDC